jgi:hypothetical protein
MVIVNEEELFEALGHNRQENMHFAFDFKNIRPDFLLQK